MKKIRFTLSRKVALNIVVATMAVIAISGYTIFKLDSNIELNKKVSEVVRPGVDLIKEFKILSNRSHALMNVIVDDFNELKFIEVQDIHNTGYPILKEKLSRNLEQWDPNDESSKMIGTALGKADELFEVQKKIFKLLENVDDYDKNIGDIRLLLFSSAKLLEETNLTCVKVTNLKRQEVVNIQGSVERDFSMLRFMLFVLIILVVVTGGITYYLTNRLILKPVVGLQNKMDKVSLGELVQIGDSERNDEIGDINKAMVDLVKGLQRTAEFAKSIGDENYEAEFEKLSDNDVLGMSLLSMRDKLKSSKGLDQERSWLTSGIAKFADILRTNNDNMEVLTQQIISELVKYLNANQGGVFVISKDKSPHVMELKAMYAYNRKKFASSSIELGEGLVGQCWEEMEKIYLTDIPANYLSITSGLGESNPRCILISPLIVNEEIFGVIEIASFKKFKEYQIEFVERLSESIASTLSAVQVNLKTTTLLTESQEMSEQMQGQEEELRQNAEEMLATQEEMQRRIDELKKEIDKK
jgi:methyl-accepting chemotaxis protein